MAFMCSKPKGVFRQDDRENQETAAQGQTSAG